VAKTFQFDLLTPDGAVWSGPVREVTAPGRDGYLGIQAGHAYFATTLVHGHLTVRWDSRSRRYTVSGGVIQVTPQKVVICAESAVVREVVFK
jgi:F-type H+-transporting ATPase subunit epsilon